MWILCCQFCISPIHLYRTAVFPFLLFSRREISLICSEAKLTAVFSSTIFLSYIKLVDTQCVELYDSQQLGKLRGRLSLHSPTRKVRPKTLSTGGDNKTKFSCTVCRLKGNKRPKCFDIYRLTRVERARRDYIFWHAASKNSNTPVLYPTSGWCWEANSGNSILPLNSCKILVSSYGWLVQMHRGYFQFFLPLAWKNQPGGLYTHSREKQIGQLSPHEIS